MTARYDVEVRHRRTAPLRHDVRMRSRLSFVDLDDLPQPPRWARHLLGFHAEDHFGGGDSIRAGVDAFLAGHDVDLRGGSITMLANPRVWGYVFNPLSVFWCHDPSGELVCTIAEVRNTYGGRHAYLLHPDDAGRAETAKDFYVSPFYPVDGHYRLQLPEPAERLHLAITLHRPGDAPFVATVRGVRATTASGLVRRALGEPLHTRRIRAEITRHGATLWAKGLPVVPRPDTPTAARQENAMTTAERLSSLLRDIGGLRLPVRLRAWDGSEAGPTDAPTVVLRRRRALRRLLWAPGELGMARAYVTGDLDVEGDLTDAFRRAWRLARDTERGPIAITPGQRVRAAVTLARFGVLGPPPAAPSSEARLDGRLHSRHRDRAAIAHHYDLSNDFYQLLLDDTMAYSSAYFAAPDQPLVDAQRAKLDLICTKLDLQPGMRLLDVGCGWGSLILHAAEHYGVHATGITLSAQQRDFVAKRIADRGLTEVLDVKLRDYREVDGGAFDAVASIEMGEHVGQKQYPGYARVLHDALRPGGRLLLQQMSRHAGAAAGGGAFIEAYIAPDMHMRPLPETLAFLEQARFEIRGVQSLREHYVTTVRQWLATFDARYPQFVALAGEEVARVWRLYLVGGALSFEEGRMGVDQVLAQRPVAPR